MPNLITEDEIVEVALIAAPDQSVYSFDWPIFEAGDLVVTVDGALPGDHDVTGAGTAEGGAVFFHSPLSGGERVVLLRDVPIRRAVDLPDTGPFSTADVDFEFDRAFAVMQQLDARVARSLKVRIGEAIGELPALADRKGRLLGFDSDTGEPMAVEHDAVAQAEAIDDALAARDAARTYADVSLAYRDEIVTEVDSLAASIITIAATTIATQAIVVSHHAFE
jgi:hypothetical protein